MGAQSLSRSGTRAHPLPAHLLCREEVPQPGAMTHSLSWAPPSLDSASKHSEDRDQVTSSSRPAELLLGINRKQTRSLKYLQTQIPQVSTLPGGQMSHSAHTEGRKSE